ncbi:MAG TPA: hypothetical protein VFQ38_02410 [Longimicrobiales bacterium]|nr:hypothetical protein [Longimicrobiales bacterium]
MATLLDRLAAKDWSGVAAMVHPRTLEGFRASQIRTARATERARAEPPQVGPPDAPPEVRAWFEAQRKKHEALFATALEAELSGAQTLAELETLPAAAVFARWLAANDPRERVARVLAARGVTSPAQQGAAEPFAEQRRVLGAVLEDDSTASVVFVAGPAAPGQGDPERRKGVATFRRTEAGWRLWDGWGETGIFPGSFAIGFVGGGEDVEPELRRAAERVVSWPAGAAPAGHARIDGYPGGGRPPRGLVVEGVGADGAVTRVTIPPEAFQELIQILAPWDAAVPAAPPGPGPEGAAGGRPEGGA